MQSMGLHGWTVRPSSGCVFCLSQRLATLAQQRVPKFSKERGSVAWPAVCAGVVSKFIFTINIGQYQNDKFIAHAGYLCDFSWEFFYGELLANP
ncbi:hypothetical protein ACGHA1_006317 [Pseudomonas aeruginosa]